MDPKRKAPQSLASFGGKNKKRIIEVPHHPLFSTQKGPDIPSSNFAAEKGKNVIRGSISNPTNITSLPQGPEKLKAVTSVLQAVRLPEIYQQVVGPNLNDLLKFERKKKKEEELKKKLEKARPPPVEKKEEKVEIEKINVIQDESGRIRDDKGNIINLKPQNTSSLKININRMKEEKVKELLHFQKSRASGMRNSKLFDPTLIAKPSAREKKKKNAFHFIEKGSVLNKAERLKSASDLEIKDPSVPTLGPEQPEENQLVSIKRPGVIIKRHDPIPDIEWWDTHLIPVGRNTYLPFEEEAKKEFENSELTPLQRLQKNIEKLYETSIQEFEYRRDKINHMIEHPAAFKSAASNQNVTIPVYLTKDEKKKQRRRKRLERQKEMQEKIKLGLIEPPPPKVKFSNFMNVLKDEAVADPTRVEMEVKKAIADRLQNHLDRNAAKKLTKEQRSQKALRKLKKDSSIETKVCVFAIDDLTSGAHRFKVSMNAQQLSLNGFCLVADKKNGARCPSVVVVEGGPKAIKFYKKLMLRRIKWSLWLAPKPKADEVPIDLLYNEKEGNMPEEPAGQGDKTIVNKCRLVWEGLVKDHSFNRWKVVDIKSEIEGRRILADRGVEHYWDHALEGSKNYEED